MPAAGIGYWPVVATFFVVALGWLLIAVVFVDVFRTVLWSGQGAGPLTGGVTAIGRRIAPHLPGGGRVRSAVGPVALALIAILWAGVLLVGFTLTLEADPDSIGTSTTKQPVPLGQRVYFVGYTLFTLGNGDLAPLTDGSRAITVLISATGLLLITTAVAYLLPVVSASVASRSFASSVRSLGETPEDVVTGAWDGTQIQLDHQLRDLAGALSQLAEQHLAYPVLHLFHSTEASASAPLAVADLDDVLTLLDGVDQRVAPLATPRRQARAAIEAYLETYGRRIDEAEVPPAPGTGRLDAAGIPLLDPPAYALAVGARDQHRSRVQGLVESSGFDR